MNKREKINKLIEEAAKMNNFSKMLEQGKASFYNEVLKNIKDEEIKKDLTEKFGKLAEEKVDEVINGYVFKFYDENFSEQEIERLLEIIVDPVLIKFLGFSREILESLQEYQAKNALVILFQINKYAWEKHGIKLSEL